MKRSVIVVLFFVAGIFIQAQAQPWVRTYPLKIDEPTAVCSLADGGYIYASSLDTATGSQVLVFKAKSSGLGVWGRAFDAPLSSKAVGCRQLKNGNILVWGDRTPVFDGSKENSSDGFLLTLDKNGGIVSQWEYGVDDWNYEYVPAQVAELAGGGYIVCGEMKHLNKSTTWYNDESKGWVAKIDAAGKILWQKAIGLTSSDTYKYVSLTGIREAAGGGYLCAGWYYSTPYWSVSVVGVVVFKLDAAGKLLWQKAFDAGTYSNGNTFLIESANLFATKDGGCLLIGMDWVEDYPWVVKLNKAGTPAWGRVFGAKNGDDEIELYASSETKDQGCLMGGGVFLDSGGRLGWFGKVGPTGVLQTTRSYLLGGNNYNHYQGMAERRTGGYVLVGRSYDDYYSREMWAMTTTPDGLTRATVKPNPFKAVLKTFKLYAKTASLKFAEGAAERGAGAFTATSVPTTSKTWSLPPATPPAAGAKEGRGLDQAPSEQPRSLKAMIRSRSKEK